MEESCKIREGHLESGLKTVILENRDLIVTILPEKGADIYSVQYKRKNNIDVLWKSPWGANKLGSKAHHDGDSGQLWLDYYPGGWQVMFPNAGGECTYQGAFHTFHGEASMVPWKYKLLDQDSQQLTLLFSTDLTRSPFKIEKKITLTAREPIIRINEKITNHGEIEMHYLWGQHIAYGAPFLNEGCQIQVPAKYITSEVHDENPHYRLVSGETNQWPLVKTTTGEMIDFSIVPSNDRRTTDLAYLTNLKDGWYAISNNELDLSVGVGWDATVLPNIWLWQEFKGLYGHPFFGRCYVMGMEPCSTPISSGLAESIKRGMADKLSPGESRELSLSMVLFEGQRSIKKITEKGEIHS